MKARTQVLPDLGYEASHKTPGTVLSQFKMARSHDHKAFEFRHDSYVTIVFLLKRISIPIESQRQVKPEKLVMCAADCVLCFMPRRRGVSFAALRVAGHLA